VDHELAIVQQHPAGIVQALDVTGEPPPCSLTRSSISSAMVRTWRTLLPLVITKWSVIPSRSRRRAPRSNRRSLTKRQRPLRTRSRDSTRPGGPLVEPIEANRADAPHTAGRILRCEPGLPVAAHLGTGYRPRWRMTWMAGIGTRKSRGRPDATRSRRSVLDISSAGTSTIRTSQPSRDCPGRKRRSWCQAG